MSISGMRKRASKRLKALGKRFKNSATAFRSGELYYHLAIERLGAFEVAYREGSTDDEQLRHSFDRDIFFPAVPEYVPARDHVILDVGAHIGTFALLAASKVPDGRVYAVEASAESFNYLRVNLALNRLTNVTPTHLALSDRRGRATLHYGEWNLGHTITRPGGRGEEVETDTLANYMAAHGIDRCDFAKFNCEGAEFPILLGSRPEVLRRIARMLILYHCDLAPGSDRGVLEAHLRAAGFTTDLRRQKGPRGWIVATRQ